MSFLCLTLRRIHVFPRCRCIYCSRWRRCTCIQWQPACAQEAHQQWWVFSRCCKAPLEGSTYTVGWKPASFSTTAVFFLCRGSWALGFHIEWDGGAGCPCRRPAVQRAQAQHAWKSSDADTQQDPPESARQTSRRGPLIQQRTGPGSVQTSASEPVSCKTRWALVMRGVNDLLVSYWLNFEFAFSIWQVKPAVHTDKDSTWKNADWTPEI